MLDQMGTRMAQSVAYYQKVLCGSSEKVSIVSFTSKLIRYIFTSIFDIQ